MSRQGAEGEGHETDVRVKTARLHVLPRRKSPRTEGAHLLSSLCSLLSSIGSEWRVRHGLRVAIALRDRQPRSTIHTSLRFGAASRDALWVAELENPAR